MSRRRLIFAGAGLAAAGAVAGAVASIPFSDNESVAASGDGPAEPVMVHLRDAASGRFDVFVGTRRIQLDDRAFAARLTSAVAG